eukprot:EG_transcript_9680
MGNRTQGLLPPSREASPNQQPDEHEHEADSPRSDNSEHVFLPFPPNINPGEYGVLEDEEEPPESAFLLGLQAEDESVDDAPQDPTVHFNPFLSPDPNLEVHAPEGAADASAHALEVSARYRTELLEGLQGKLAEGWQHFGELVLSDENREVGTHRLQTMDRLVAAAATVPYTCEAACLLDRLAREVERLRWTLEQLRKWPRGPLPIPTAPPPGSYHYFEHPSEGRIKLRWTNPLPFTTLDIPTTRCDMCGKRVQAAWSHVSYGDERDTSTFFFNRVGWDICFPCFDAWNAKERAVLVAAAERAAREAPPTQRSVVRSPVYHGHMMKILGLEGKDGKLDVHLEAPASGEYLVCTAAPAPHLPDCWAHATVETLYSLEQFRGEEAPSCSICLDSVLDTTEGRIRPVRTNCGHFFHESCLRLQFRGTMGSSGCRRCPLCRKEDPLDLVSNPDIQLQLRVSLSSDCHGAPFAAGAQYLVACVMAADKDLPLESHSSVTFHAIPYPQ